MAQSVYNIYPFSHLFGIKRDKKEQFSFLRFFPQENSIEMQELIFQLIAEGKNIFIINDCTKGKLAEYLAQETGCMHITLNDDDRLDNVIMKCKKEQYIVTEQFSATAGILMDRFEEQIQIYSHTTDVCFAADIIHAVIDMGRNEFAEPYIKAVYKIENFTFGGYIYEKLALYDKEREAYKIISKDYV